MRIDLRSARSLALGCALAGMPGIAAAQEPPNGDFEAGVLEPWFGSGDIGVSQDNVLEGAWSGFLTTGPNAVGEVCSYLHSPEVFPPTDQGRAKVTFKVRYKTDEGTGPFAFFEDPFHAEFVTVRGALDLLTIKTDGIFWTKGNPTGTSVIDEATGTKLQGPPQIPPFGPGVLFGSETPTLSASSEIKLKGCEPVRIKFEICDWVDQIVDSAAYVDAVNISFKEDGKKCPDNQQFSIEGGQGIPVRQ
jgi:hypothetical protein